MKRLLVQLVLLVAQPVAAQVRVSVTLPPVSAAPAAGAAATGLSASPAAGVSVLAAPLAVTASLAPAAAAPAPSAVAVPPAAAASEARDQAAAVPAPTARVQAERAAAVGADVAAVFDNAAPSRSATQSAALLLKAPFIKTEKYTKELLRNLKPVKQAPKSLLKAGLKFSPGDMAGFNAALRKRFAGSPLTPVLYGPLKASDEKGDHVVFFGVLEREGAPSGTFSYIVHQGDDGALVGHISAVDVDRSKPVSGVAAALLGFFKEDLAPALGVTREGLKADYAGRYVWAKREYGFQFDPDDRFYDVDGKRYPTVVVARRSLARFMKKHKTALTDLLLRGKPVASLDELDTPADFAELERKDGGLIAEQPLTRHKTLAEAAQLPFGKAFMLADYLPKEKPLVYSKGGPVMGTKFAPDAMPFWNGHRVLARLVAAFREVMVGVFDADDNLWLNANGIWVFKKGTDHTIKVRIPSEEFAHVRQTVGQAGKYADYEYWDDQRQGSFWEFYDQPGRNVLLENLKRMVEERTPAQWQGKSWQAFRAMLHDNAKGVHILTASGVSRKNFLEALKFLKDKGFIDALPPEQNIQCVGNPQHPFYASTGSPSKAKLLTIKRLILDPMQKLAEKLKAEGRLPPLLLGPDGDKREHLMPLGFSDDDPGNISAMKDGVKDASGQVAEKGLAAEFAAGAWPDVKISLFDSDPEDPKAINNVIKRDGTLRLRTDADDEAEKP